MKRFVFPGAVVAVAVWAWLDLDIEAARLWRAPAALAWLARESWPLDLGPAFLQDVSSGLVETLQIAFLSTLAGTALSLPLALLAARNLAPVKLVVPARLLAAAIRVLPSLLWAILAVVVFGLGPLAGIVAMTFYTVGYLAKFQYEALEGLPRDSLDAVRAMGVGRVKRAWHVALPEAGNALRSQMLFMLEYNVRASAIVGLVGAGGIGFKMAEALRFSQFDRLVTILLVIFLMVVILDVISMLVRRRYLELDEAPRARWRDLLLPHPPRT